MELAKAVQFNIPIEWSISKKVDYLEQKRSNVKSAKLKCAKYLTSGIDVSREVAFLQIKECDIGIRKIEVMLRDLKKKRNLDGISDEMIDRAKQYPLSELIDTSQRVIRCINPDHEDRSPSMDTKDNRVWCYSCGFNEGVIGVAMLVWHVDFKEAVKKMQ